MKFQFHILFGLYILGIAKDGVYKAPEYYGYNKMTFYDIDATISHQRLKVPNVKEAYIPSQTTPVQ